VEGIGYFKKRVALGGRPKIERTHDIFVVQDDWAIEGKLRMAEVRLKR